MKSLILWLSLFQTYNDYNTVVVDVVEVNAVIDTNTGDVRLRQVIFWDISTSNRRICQGWKLDSKCQIAGNTCYTKDTKVRFKTLEISLTDYDPELEARGEWPTQWRSVK